MKNNLIEAIVGAIFGVAIILTSALTSADLAVIVLGALLAIAALVYIYVCVKNAQVSCCCCEETKPATKATKKAATKKTATKKAAPKKTTK